MECATLKIVNETLAKLDHYLLTRGVPMPAGVVQDEKGVTVKDAKGNVLPSEAKVLHRRLDGSVEWILMDILLKLGGEEQTTISVEPRRATRRPALANPVVLREKGKLVTLSNGISEITVSRAGGSLIHRLIIDGKTIADDSTLVDLQVVDIGGKIYRASLSGAYNITVTHRNRLRTEIKVEGKHSARDKSTFMDFALRFTLTAGNPDIKMEHTFYCREPEERRHFIRSMRLIMPTLMDPGAQKLLGQKHHGEDYFHRNVKIAENIEVVSSSVVDIDNYREGFKGAVSVHPCAGGDVFLRNGDSLKEDWSEYPFYMRPGQSSSFRADQWASGVRKVEPIIGWQEKGFTLATSFEHFRQLHPKSIAIDENVVTYSFWPGWSFPMMVAQGVSKSHIIWITGKDRAMNMDQVMDIMGRWEFGYVEPVDVSFDPAWPAFCDVLDCQHFLKYQPEKYTLLENLIEPSPGSGNPRRHTYDRQSAIGMFHFADIVNSSGTQCYNNEDDCHILFPLQHFLRTGHTYAWDFAKEAARHYMEVDFCEWSTSPRQNGGLHAHTDQHFLGHVFPSHQWVEGLLAYYFLSGDERARNVVVSVGDNYVWWAYNKMDCFFDGREAGMPLVNLALVHRLTRDEKYIKAARQIVDNFVVKCVKKHGSYKYASPQNIPNHPKRFISGYGDWSTFAGLFLLWQETNDEFYRSMVVKMIKQSFKPGSIAINDDREMDFYSIWALGVMTGDMDAAIKLVEPAIPMFLRRGGIPVRRLHFLKELDERGMIDETKVGHVPIQGGWERPPD
jgi:hypothetical protein